jgi:hypothetical protein
VSDKPSVSSVYGTKLAWYAESSPSEKGQQMELLGHIEHQIEAAKLPLFAITLAAVPCPDTPVILTLHWHAFIREKLADVPGADTVFYTSVPSSALQLNERWDDLMHLDLAAMEAGWEMGAWDVARVERRPALRAGASAHESLECLQAFGAPPFGVGGASAIVSDTPDADELVHLAAKRGYLMWQFRPVRNGIWAGLANDLTLNAEGGREPSCPVIPVKPRCEATRKTVYRFGIAGSENTYN